MPAVEAARPSRFRSACHGALLSGVSSFALLTLLAAASPAHARCLFCSGDSAAATNAAMSAAISSAQQAGQVSQAAQAALARAAAAIRAMQAVQANARGLALGAASSVPNGLVAGGLVPDSGLASPGVAKSVLPTDGGTWIGANTPTQSSSGGQTVVTINQTAPQALLNWQTFNVGAQTTVNFNQQGNTSWIALNKIAASGVPSQILGSIRADGSVYIINQNGIIFGGSSQVNVNTLVASALDLNDPGNATFPSYSNFLSGKGIFTGSPTFVYKGDSASPNSVTVQAGAQINAGGKVLLMAPTVENDGAISTPSGQTLLLGGSSATLQTADSYVRGYFVCPVSGCAGVLTTAAAYQSSGTPGTVINNGSISAPQGNITIVAGQVQQNGVLTSTTSTTQNGSIILRAEIGTLALGDVNDNPLYAQYGVAAQPSLVQIVPDATDTSMVSDTQVIANSAISLTGVNVDIRGIVQLHGFDVINATNPTSPNDPLPGISITATGYVNGQNTTGSSTTGQVFLETESLIDASGATDAVASASRNSVAVQLRTSELRDSPLVEGGPLYQQTIFVDATTSGTYADGSTWYGTPLADAGSSGTSPAGATGWIGGIKRSLDERLMNGAPIVISGGIALGNQPVPAQPTFLPPTSSNLLSANVVQASGSIINISGGYLTYTSGFVQVSELLMANGHRVSATNASPDVNYVGVCCSFTVDHAHWGVTEVFSMFGQGYTQPGYIQGGAGGSLTIAASSAVLDGDVEANVATGIKQRTAASAPTPAALSINGLTVVQPADGGTIAYLTDNIVLSNNLAATAAQWTASFPPSTDLNSVFAANSATSNTVYLPSSWLNSGFGNVSLGANDKISLPAGNPIDLPVGASLSLSANTVDIRSSISAPSGSITLTGAYTTGSTLTSNSSSTNSHFPTQSARSGLVAIGAGVTLSAAGTWTNDASMDFAYAIATNGGAITLNSYGDIFLGEGSVFDVSGGGYESKPGSISSGAGGTLTLAAGLAPKPNVSVPVVPRGFIDYGGGTLTAGQFRGYGVNGAKGGKLTLVSDDVATIVSAGQTNGALLTQLPPANDAFGNSYKPLVVSTDFFSAGGFMNIGLTAAGIDLPAGVTLAPVVASLAVTNPMAPSQSSLAGVVAGVILPQGIRPAGSLTLHSVGDLWNRGVGATPLSVDPSTYSLNIAGNIEVDPTGSVTLTGDQIAIVSGIVSAPAGSIALSGGTYGSSLNAPLLDGLGVWLTATGVLSAAGTEISVPQKGRTLLDVLPGGQVSVSGGDIILVPGSLIDVSGASGLSSAGGPGSSPASVGPFASFGGISAASNSSVSSAGGMISISALLGGVLEGTLLGSGGGGNASGGTLSVSIAGHGGNSTDGSRTNFWKVEDTYITLVQNLQPGDADYVGGTALVPGINPIATPTNDANIPLSVAMINDGGFASLILNTPVGKSAVPNVGGNGYVRFAGNVNLTLPNQLVIQTGTIVLPASTATDISAVTDVLRANYIRWDNSTTVSATKPADSTNLPNNNTLDIQANNIDLIGNLAVQRAAVTNIVVAGDVRLTPNIALGSSSFVSVGDLNFTANQIYPSTASTYTLASATEISFMANGAPPIAPLSAGGVLNVYAPVINQSGTLRAPTGTINLGTPAVSNGGTTGGPDGSGNWSFVLTGQQNFAVGESIAITSPDGAVALTGMVTSLGGSIVGVLVTTSSGPVSAELAKGTGVTWNIVGQTQSVTLGKGSFTSVSTDGETSLYGYVLNGTTWYYDPFGTTAGHAVSAPPAKQVSLVGQNVVVSPGATVDESGGGDLFAGAFVPGTGGSKNIFTGQNRNIPAGAQVYAVIPGFSGLMPYDPNTSPTGPSAGQQVYLNGTPGLPAGTYTLLPPAYAQFPNAFLVIVQSSGASSATSNNHLVSATLPDGSGITSGYFITPGAGTITEHWSTFQVMSDAVARRYTEIDNFSANTFFVAQAAANGTTVPRLPQDAGQLSINALATLSFGGTGEFAHPNGLGGLADISAEQILVVDTTTRNALLGLTPGSPAYEAALAAYIPGGTNMGGAVSATSTTSLTVSSGAQTLVIQSNLIITVGQSVTIVDSADPNHVVSMTGTVSSYDATTGMITINVTSTQGSGVASAWDVRLGPNSTNWTPIVLSAGDLSRLGVESLLLGGSRSFIDPSTNKPYTDGVHFTPSATAVVVANDGNDPLVLPDIQLLATPQQGSISFTDPSGLSGNPPALNVASPVAGTGQVIIAPNAVIEASGAVAPNEASSYVLSSLKQIAPPPQVLGNSVSYNISDVTKYYQAALANEVGYVRLSGGGLATLTGGNANYIGLPAVTGSTSSTSLDWAVASSALTLKSTLTLTVDNPAAFQVGNGIQIVGSGNVAGSPQIIGGAISAINGDTLTITVGSVQGSGHSTSETVNNLTSLGSFYHLQPLAVDGSVTIGKGAVLKSDNSLTVFGTGSATIGQGVAIAAQQAELKSTLVSLGTGNSALPGLVLDQAALTGLAGVGALTLVSSSTIDLYGNLSLGEVNSTTGEPILSSLIFDSAGLVEKGASGTATFTAEQVTFQNSQGANAPAPQAPTGGVLVVDAVDVSGMNQQGQATGYNNAQIALGAGNVTLAGFSSVDLSSSGRITMTANGSLNVQGPLTLDTPRIDAGSMTINPSTGLPQFSNVSYTINAIDNPANPGTYYTVNLGGSNSTVALALPAAFPGSSLTINAGDINVNTSIVLPGGTVTLNANGSTVNADGSMTGNSITVDGTGNIDVSGQAQRFVDVLATIGGGNINLSSASGAISIQSGAVVNVGDLADVGALNQTSAGTLTLSAPQGGVFVAAGTLQGQGPTADAGGSFVLDTNSLDQPSTGALMTYDQLAAVLNSGSFTKSWNIRARSGDILMSGLSQARSVTVSLDGNIVSTSSTSNVALNSVSVGSQQTFVISGGLQLASGDALTLSDQANGRNYLVGKIVSYDPTSGKLVVDVVAEGGSGAPAGWNVYAGNIDITGAIDAHGATPGQINIFAGNSLILENTAQLNAHGVTADANGRGGQIWLEADATGAGTGVLNLNSGARIDVGADVANSIDSGPVLGGQITLATARNSAGVNLTVDGNTNGSLANFLNGVSGESAWDGIAIVGDKTYKSTFTASTTTVNETLTLSTGVQTLTVPTGLNLQAGQGITLANGSAGGVIGSVISYDSTTGALKLDVTAASGTTTSSNWTLNASTDLILTPLNFQSVYLNEAASFMANESAIWQNYGANGAIAGVVTTTNANAVIAAGLTNVLNNQVLINVRPGIVIENTAGAITVMGDSLNWKGIDLSGSAYVSSGGSKSALNTGDSQSLIGHFGQYDEPIVLAMRAAGNINFGLYTGAQATNITLANLSSYLQLGTLSDGFSQYSDGLVGLDGVAGHVALGAGGSSWAAPFDPAAVGAYNGLSGGLGANSATYFLTAGADLSAANPGAINPNTMNATITVAGVAPNATSPNPGGPGVVIVPGPVENANNQLFYRATTDPFYVYNYDWSGGNVVATMPTDWLGGNSPFADYASMVRTGTGNISIATGKDLVLQSSLSLIYTAGTGYNVNGTNNQPLSGFTQYSGIMKLGATKTSPNNADYLQPSTFPTHGGDVVLTIGGNIIGAMNLEQVFQNSPTEFNPINRVLVAGDTEDLPYDMTALASQLKLQNWITQSPTDYGPAGTSTLFKSLLGSFSDLYATDNWMRSIPASSSNLSYYTEPYTVAGTAGRNLPDTVTQSPPTATGTYQMAWYTIFPYLENTIGSFGGGNISVKAGGSISNVQFVAPTNARDAGPYLVGSSYGRDASLAAWSAQPAIASAIAAGLINPVTGYDGLYVQGGGNVTVISGGNITNVYTYVQNGTTSLQSGGSVSQLFLATATGDVSVQAMGSITISDKQVTPAIGGIAYAGIKTFKLSGISLIQNAGIATDLVPYTGGATKNVKSRLANTVLTGILTTAPTGSLTLQALGDVTLDVSAGPSLNTNQGILSAQVNLISLGGDIINNASFTSYPSPTGSVNLLAQGSVTLNAGFVVSDADPSIMPTWSNIAGVLAPLRTVVTASNATSTTLAPGFDSLLSADSAHSSDFYYGGANYLAGQDTGSTDRLNPAPFSSGGFLQTFNPTALQGDVPALLIRDATAVSGGGPVTGIAQLAVDPLLEAERHHGLHVGQSVLSRIIGLNGDVTEGDVTQSHDFTSPYVNVTTASEVYAGRDIVDLALIGQNNNASDFTSIIAGRDLSYPLILPNGSTWRTPFAIEVGGPGNLVVESGRNVDLGNSTGIQTIGNFLDPTSPSQGGASITIMTGLGSALTLPGYAAFTTQFVDPATAATNPYFEPLELFDAKGNLIGSGDQAYAYLNGLGSPNGSLSLAQEVLLNRIFFGLVRDSGREHTGAAGGGNYELTFGGNASNPVNTIDTVGALNNAFANYQRAFAAIGTFFGGTSGTGDFLGGLSTVRTLDGGNISILSPHGQIQVGIVAPPAVFPGYSKPGDGSWALNFGIVSEKGGDVDLYAKGDISVNQSRVFTLEGGDLIAVSQTGNIDAGKGAKTVQSVQPASVSYDAYGNETVTPFGSASGSGLAVLRGLPDTPLGNADLIAFVGSINAGDAGIRVSGNINLAALVVLNASNIQVGGTATGVPTVVAPNIAALTSATNTAGAAAKTAEPPAANKNSDQPSIIIVEFLGFGGGDGDSQPQQRHDDDKRNKPNQSNQQGSYYDPDAPVRVVGYGGVPEADTQALTEEEKRQLAKP